MEIAATETIRTVASHKEDWGLKFHRAMKNVWKERPLSGRGKMGMFEGSKVFLMVLYGCEAWAVDKNVQKRVNVWKMKCMRAIYGG